MNLKGKIFISTVNKLKSKEFRTIFESRGAIVADFPVTEVISTKMTADMLNTFSHLNRYQWIIFTSTNGVRFFHQFLKEIVKTDSIPRSIKVAVIGVSTAEEVQRMGHVADFTGTGATAGDLIAQLVQDGTVRNHNILLPLGDLARDLTEIKLSEFANVKRINVYQTKAFNAYPRKPVELIRSNKYDLILFTSPSGVEGFTSAMKNEKISSEIRAAAIGRVTAGAVSKAGYNCIVTASHSTYTGLADEVTSYYSCKN